MTGQYNLALAEFKLGVGEARAHASLAKIISPPKGGYDEARKGFAAGQAAKHECRSNSGSDVAGILAEIFSGEQLPDNKKKGRLPLIRSRTNFARRLLPPSGSRCRMETASTAWQRKVGEYLSTRGFLPARFTNADNFNQPKTSIYYGSGYQDQAHKLSMHLLRRQHQDAPAAIEGKCSHQVGDRERPGALQFFVSNP